MSLAEVLLRWFYLTLGFALIILLSLQWIEFPVFERFTWIWFVFSALLSVILFPILRFLKTKYKKAETTVFVFFLIGMRLLLSFGFLIIYISLNHPLHNSLALPFIVIYTVYKIFEVYCLIQYSNYIDKRVKQKII